MRRARALGILAGLFCLIASMAVSVPASARIAQGPVWSLPLEVQLSPGAALRDDVLEGEATASGTALPIGTHREEWTTTDGYTVELLISPRYLPNEEASRWRVEFLEALLHGAELDRLSMYIAPPEELAEICGDEAAACYEPGKARMYVTGDLVNGGITISSAIAHEYGHHVATFRRNPPFRGGAAEWGTKRWASQKNICVRNLRRQVFTGYFSHPGEAFAESYAWANEPEGSIPWRWAGFLRPNSLTFSAIRRDVASPWRVRRSSMRGVVSPRGSPRVFHIGTPFDGTVQVRLTGRGADLDIYLLDRSNRWVKRSIRWGAREKVNYIVCGERRLKVAVFAYGGVGRFTLQVARP